MSRERPDPHPLAPDDPRLSEWLDGRLTAAEAAEVERLVAASPELTRLVADLRGMRGALGAVPVTPPPTGFVRDVLAAIDAAGEEAADGAEVEEEWRRIERQRLEGEIAEAEDDAAEPPAEPMRQRWPWLALAGALAAGVLVAVVINRPGGLGDREVALVDEVPVRKRSPADRPAESAGAEKPKAEFADTWLEEDADATAADARALAGAPASDKAAENAEALADRAPLPAAVPAAPGVEAAKAAVAAAEPRVRSVTYRIRTAADRRRLDELLAASDGVQRQAAAEAKSDGAAEAESLAREGGPAAERIVLSGPAATLASLAAALEAVPDVSRGGGKGGVDEATMSNRGRSAAEEQAAAAPPAAAVELAARAKDLQPSKKRREAEALLVIDVVDESGTAAGEDGP